MDIEYYCANDSTHAGYANARALMTLVFHKQYIAPIYPMTHNDEALHHKNISGENTPLSHKNQYSLYPNPANNVLMVENVNNNNSNATLIIYSELGDIVAQYALPPSETVVTENITNLAAGFYLYSITSEVKVIQRGKLIIER